MKYTYDARRHFYYVEAKNGAIWKISDEQLEKYHWPTILIKMGYNVHEKMEYIENISLLIRQIWLDSRT